MDGETSLTVEGVPKWVFDRLTLAAEEDGLSLWAYVAKVLADGAWMYQTPEGPAEGPRRAGAVYQYTVQAFGQHRADPGNA